MDSVEIPDGAVVVGIDGSEHSSRALTWAADQADRDRRPLVIMHALSGVDPYWMVQPVVDVQALKASMVDGAEQLLAAARDAVASEHPALDVAVGSRSEDPRHLLIEASEHAAMVVVGSHGRGPVKRLLLGSVSVGLTRHARCPVAVVRPDHGMPRRSGVLVGIDGTPQSLLTLDQAFRISASRDAPLTVVHCFLDTDTTGRSARLITPDDEKYDELRLVVEEALAGVRERYPEVPVTIELVEGLADDVLLRLASGLDVAVVGSHERSTLSDLVLGSVAGTLVEHATCTVVVVPRP